MPHISLTCRGFCSFGTGFVQSRNGHPELAKNITRKAGGRRERQKGRNRINFEAERLRDGRSALQVCLGCFWICMQSPLFLILCTLHCDSIISSAHVFCTRFRDRSNSAFLCASVMIYASQWFQAHCKVLLLVGLSHCVSFVTFSLFRSVRSLGAFSLVVRAYSHSASVFCLYLVRNCRACICSSLATSLSRLPFSHFVKTESRT